MGLIYLDSSVLIDAIGVSSDRGVRTRAHLAKSAGAGTFAISPLVNLECMVRPIRTGHGAGATQTFLNRFRRLEITERAYELATHIRAIHALGVPDALHFATARLAECDMLWTFDRALIAAAPSFAVDPLALR